jgi:hypothetical protein
MDRGIRSEQRTARNEMQVEYLQAEIKWKLVCTPSLLFFSLKKQSFKVNSRASLKL